MKKLGKIIAVVSAAAILAGSFAGCGGKDEKVTKATTDGKSFTYWGVMNSSASLSNATYNDMMMFQEMEKRTGIHIDFIHPLEGSTGGEAFVAMLTAKELPDMIEYQWNNYSGGPQAALDDEVIICLNDYLEEYAPNYYDYMEGEKGKKDDYAYKLESTTDDGRYYGFYALNIGETKGFTGLYTRADLLKKWGMAVPETIDEWEAVFKKAKAEGFSKPYTGVLDTLSFKNAITHTFNTAYGVGKYFYLEGDKVVFAPFEKGYKEYMAQIAEWVKAGYIDTGFVTNDDKDIQGNMLNGISMAAWGYVGGGMGSILPAGKKIDPTFDLVACPYPVANKGEASEFQQVYDAVAARSIAITTECGNYEKAVEWCDYRYSEEGVELMVFGIEGDTYTVEEIDGEKHYTYTDKITDLESNGHGSVGAAMYAYMLPCNYPGYNQHIDYLYGMYQEPRQREALKTWNTYVEEAKLHKIPPLSYTEEEKTEITDIKEVAEPALEVALCDIILGQKSIDTYDEAIEKAKAAGYDRWIEIMQEAYDRFMTKV